MILICEVLIDSKNNVTYNMHAQYSEYSTIHSSYNI